MRKKYQAGYEISLPETSDGEEIYIAGAKKEDGVLKTAGGRVLGAVAREKTLKKAIEKAYALAKNIKFDNAYMRSDIGKRALAAKTED